MINKGVARRYAKSLMDAAIANNKIEQLHQDVNTVLHTLENNDQLRVILQNPIIRGTKKLNILRKVFTPYIDKLTLAELELLAKKSREEVLFNICTEFNNLYFEQKNMVFAEIITALPIAQELVTNLEKILSAKLVKNVSLRTKVDKTIIGGFIINIKDKQIDSSIKSQLKKLKLQFSQK